MQSYNPQGWIVYLIFFSKEFFRIIFIENNWNSSTNISWAYLYYTDYNKS